MKTISKGVSLPAAADFTSRRSLSSKNRIFRTLRLLLLCCAALVLTFALPRSPWSLFSAQRSTRIVRANLALSSADEWKDDVWPIRPPTPWDISTDFPHPRVLEYDVQEGTWLRLDVNPKSGDIIFDMAGDIYCLPSESYTRVRDSQARASNVVFAHPVLLGVPHDSDPHFSPEGDRIVFRSDAELGVENIWVRKWAGCVLENLRPDEHSIVSDELREALVMKVEDESMLVRGIKENPERKRRRLLREGRHGAQRVTNETYRWVSDARFHPSGSKVIATKWYTSERSLGAGEGWQYDVPSLSGNHQVGVGAGKRIVGRTLPSGWSSEDYGDQQIGPEQLIWRGGDAVIYAKNVRDSNGVFTYSKDVHKGIYAIFSTNLTTGKTETLVPAFPGGASRPELSRDGKTLAFVRRIRDKEALVLKDLETGTLNDAWYGLTYDLSTVSAPMGTYPSFAFTPSDDGIVIWADGKIHIVYLTVNSRGEKVAAGDPAMIGFTAHIEKRLAETRRSVTDLLSLETQERQRVHAFEGLKVDAVGARAIFQAAGATYVQRVGGGLSADTEKVPVLHADAPYYSPTFVHGADDLVLHARWSNINFTTLEFANLTSGTAYEVRGLPLGRYYSPAVCECVGNRRKIAFVKTAGDVLTGNVVATANPGIYVGDLTLPSPDSSHDLVVVEHLRFVPSEIDLDDKLDIRFVQKNAKILVQQSQRAFVVDLAAGPDAFGEYVHLDLAQGKMSTQIAVSTQEEAGNGKAVKAGVVAFTERYHVYVASKSSPDVPVWTKPGNATRGVARLSLDGGHDIAWSRDGKKLFWFLGPYLHSIEISKLDQCSSEIAKDGDTFGIACVRKLLQYQEVLVDYPTDIQRLKEEALISHRRTSASSAANADVLIIANATILTLESKTFAEEPIRGALVTRGGLIEQVVEGQNLHVPEGATVIDAQGGFVVPGFIDVHAHWASASGEGPYPASSWEHQTFLAYGVTTVHNPSTDTVITFAERSRIESGQIVGPRVFHTGTIIYGAGNAEYHQDIVDDAEAYSALLRIKVEGGPASFSYKNYNLPSRAARQRLLLNARNLSMLCVPEGGMNLDWDLTYIVDGMTTVEHSIPVPKLYDDILTLFAKSGTGSTPTHIVNYGGAWGEQLVWATEDVPNDPKLRRFLPHDHLEDISESTARPYNSFALFNTSASTAKMVQKGLRAHIGAHGENPIGLNYHAEMWFTTQGGLSNYESDPRSISKLNDVSERRMDMQVLRAATSDAADTLGLLPSLGSLTPGKLADFLVYPPGFDLLEDDIRGTRSIRYVARGGRLWDAETMREEWPSKGRKQALPPLNED